MSRRWLVLSLLRDAGDRGITTAEFLEAHCGSRFGARIQELRDQGHIIEAERVRAGSYRYTLTHDAERAGGPSDPSLPTSRSLGAVVGPGAPGGPSLSDEPAHLFEIPPALPKHDEVV